MPKITIHAGVTLPGSQEYSSFRGDVTFTDIDTQEPLVPQLKECIEAVEETGRAVEEALATQASNLSGMNVEGVGIATEFQEFRRRLRTAWEDLVAKVNKHDDVIQALEATGRVKVLVEEEPEEKPTRKPRKTKRD